MHIHQTAPITLPWHRSHILSGSCHRAAQIIRARWDALRSRGVAAKLPPHLRYDIGELDCRPLDRPPFDHELRPGPIDLETMWRRYGC
jgi:hypothetical protein